MPPRVVYALEVVGVYHYSMYVEVVAAGKREFAEGAVKERAAVRDLGERVHGGRLEQLSVEFLFGAVLEVDFQDHLADLQAVVRFEHAFGDGLPVDECSVGAS